ncbi:MAG: NYN domain-containing protein [Lentisphaeria bacterium]|nr:NYN domain-containing protein [Lentisphaeria bacterium]
MNSSTNRKVALFIDHDSISLEGQSYEDMLSSIPSKFQFLAKKAFGQWAEGGEAKQYLLDSGFEIIEIAGASDVKLAVDLMQFVIGKESLNSVILLTNSASLIPAVKKVQEYDASVDVITQEENSLFKNIADRVFVVQGNGTTLKSRKELIPENVIELLRKAILTRLQRGSQIDAAGLKLQLKQFESSFSERKWGFSNFNEFLQEVGYKKLLPIKLQFKNGAWNLELLGDDWAQKAETKTILNQDHTCQDSGQWEDRDLNEKEWEIFAEAVIKCIAEGQGRPNQGKLWIINAYLHRKRMEGILLISNNALFRCLQELVDFGVLNQPSQDTYLLASGYQDSIEDFLNDKFGEVVVEEVSASEEKEEDDFPDIESMSEEEIEYDTVSEEELGFEQTEAK